MFDYFFLDAQFSDIPRHYHKKLELLQEQYGLVATDDIALVISFSFQAARA
jgi:predicted O-methyltransferase YrrM